MEVFCKITRDRSATSLSGTQATPQQITNANLANFLYHTWLRLSKLNEEQLPAVFNTLEPSIKVSVCHSLVCLIPY